jgi:hypothetical protein
MRHGVLVDYHGTLDHLSTCGTSRQAVFERHHLLAVSARWSDERLAERHTSCILGSDPGIDWRPLVDVDCDRTR